MEARALNASYQPTGAKEVMDDNDLNKINLNQIRVAEVSNTFDGVTTKKTCLLIHGQSVQVDFPTRVMFTGIDLAKIKVEPKTIVFTVWEPNAERKAAGWKDSLRCSFDYDILD